MVDEFTVFAGALVKWLPGVRADSWEIIKCESLARKFHTRAINLLASDWFFNNAMK